MQHDTVQNLQREALRSVGMRDVTAQAVSQDQVCTERECVCEREKVGESV